MACPAPSDRGLEGSHGLSKQPLGYSFGYFEGKDLLKVGAILTLVEGLILMVLVPLYWPLLGLPWQATPAAQAAIPSAHEQAAPEPRTSGNGEARAMLVRRVQERLAQLEFDVGPVDGQLGPRTAAALRQLQIIHGLPVTGRVDNATLAALDIGKGVPDAGLIKYAQALLRRAGFDPGPVDGRPGPRTAAALRHFQEAHGLAATGAVDGATLTALHQSFRREGTLVSEGDGLRATVQPDGEAEF
jgi:peptidoglycan hydrolase-like protein with peptidoglycan-binding domain